MKFNIVTFGCKVNQYESNMMKEKMLSSNFFYEENMSDANIIIVNTCSVTNVADKKCLKMINYKKIYIHSINDEIINEIYKKVLEDNIRMLY